jgi:hypothetical protein
LANWQKMADKRAQGPRNDDLADFFKGLGGTP